eukprot:6434812-Prymnesium_polylepis.1
MVGWATAMRKTSSHRGPSRDCAASTPVRWRRDTTTAWCWARAVPCTLSVVEVKGASGTATRTTSLRP